MFRPAGYSDSDEDSNFGYDFVYSKPDKEPKKDYSPPKVSGNYDDVLYNAVLEGNLDQIKSILERDQYFLTGCLRHGWPLLLIACSEAQFDIVRFLIDEKGVDVNMAWVLKTPLMIACESSRDPVDVYKIVILLLEYGAVINCKDNYGMTPLMFAIINGHTEVVKLIIDQASLEATDNDGLTALFHAVNNKRIDIVELLLKAGAATDVINRRGFTAKQEAEFKGYLDIAKLFPAPEDAYEIPVKYLYYTKYKDISQGDCEDELPGYSQEIGSLLLGMNSERHLKTFAKENFDLLRFLTLTDVDLKQLGFVLPFERKKILHGLLKFHQHSWKKGSLRKFPKDHKYDCFDIFEILCNHLKQVIIMQSSLIYVDHMMNAANIKFDPQFKPELVECLENVNQLRNTIASFEESLQRIDTITKTKPVLLIDAGTYQKRGRGWISATVKISFLLGVASFLIYRKLKH